MGTGHTAEVLTDIGARAVPDFEGVHDIRPRGERWAVVRTAAHAYKKRFKSRGTVRAVRSVDIAAAPYPVTLGFDNAVSVPTLPMITMIRERILADPCHRDPRWLQNLPSNGLAPWKRFWPVVPTFAHGGISYGRIEAR